MKLSLLLIALAVFMTCNSSSEQSKTSQAQTEQIPENIDIETFDRLRGGGDYLVIDVRTPEEFDAGHIPGAMDIDVKAMDFNRRIDSLDKDKNYLVYCRSGNRSSKALQMMKEAGFKNAHNVEGGYLAWSEVHKEEK